MTRWICLSVWFLTMLFGFVACDSEDCDCDESNPAQGGDDDDDDDADDDDDNDDASPPGDCAAGERRCNAAEVPEQCVDGAWATLEPCPRMQYCNFGACLDTLLDLPADESPHRDFIEWWYWTGNMTDEDGNVYGFELTFFYGAAALGIPAWMVHTGVVSASTNEHFRDVWFDIHWADENPAELHLASRSASADRGADDVFRLVGETPGAGYDLTLTDLKGAAHHGGNGSVRMSSRTVDSFYYSRTRMALDGQLDIGGSPLAVEGEAWMDHQWGNFIPFVLIGWDWYSLQFDDGSEIMYYVFRGDENDPSVIDMALGTYVDPSGEQTILSQDEVVATPLDSWTSDETGTAYPQNWNFKVPGMGLDVDVVTDVPNQEMPNFMWDYWEGMVRIDGVKGDKPATGMGFVELSGYGGRPAFWWLFPSAWGDDGSL